MKWSDRGAFSAALLGAVFAACSVMTAAPANAFPDVKGGLYKDVKQTLSSVGYSVVIAGKVGDVVAVDKCVVQNAQPAAFRNASGVSQGKIALVYLNCYADVSSRYGPGYSAASPEGRAALEAQKKAQEKKEADQAAAEAAQSSG